MRYLVRAQLAAGASGHAGGPQQSWAVSVEAQGEQSS